MIGLWIDAQDDEVLGRLAHVNTSEWDAGHAWREDGETHGCLLCHAFDCRTEQDYDRARAADGADDEESFFGVTEGRYIDLCDRFGDARIGRLISERARRVLEERKPVETFVRVSLPTISEPFTVRQEAHVSLNCEPVRAKAAICGGDE